MKSLARLIVIVDLEFCKSIERWLEVLRQIDSAELGDAVQVQLRAKNLATSERPQVLQKARSLISVETFVVLNGTTKEAREHRFDGVHWSESTLADEDSGHFCNYTVSAAMHSADSIKLAAEKGANQFVFSPVFQPTWKSAEPQGTDVLNAFVEQTSLPVYALGGVTVANCRSCLDAGAVGVATLSEVCKAESPLSVIQNFLEELHRPGS